MIIDRFGRDLQKMYEENGKQFSHKTVLQLGLRIVSLKTVFLFLQSVFPVQVFQLNHTFVLSTGPLLGGVGYCIYMTLVLLA